MARQSKTVEKARPPSRTLPDKILVIDNGAYSMKAGYTTPNPDESHCITIPNCLAKSRDNRVWIGAQLEKCVDFGDMVFRRPLQKGYLVNWESEKEIWENTFFDKGAKIKVTPSIPQKITLARKFTNIIV